MGYNKPDAGDQRVSCGGYPPSSTSSFSSGSRSPRSELAAVDSTWYPCEMATASRSKFCWFCGILSSMARASLRCTVDGTSRELAVSRSRSKGVCPAAFCTPRTIDSLVRRKSKHPLWMVGDMAILWSMVLPLSSRTAFTSAPASRRMDRATVVLCFAACSMGSSPSSLGELCSSSASMRRIRCPFPVFDSISRSSAMCSSCDFEDTRPPSLSSSSSAPACPDLAARCAGVEPSESGKLTFCGVMSFPRTMSPFFVAATSWVINSCRAVRPWLSTWLGSAEYFSSLSTSLIRPRRAAAMRAVLPVLSVALVISPSPTRRSSTSRDSGLTSNCSLAHARSKAVPCSSCTFFGSAP
eukprot:Sspe_Gene.40116::Locus_19348_Transcript_1_1_Confidence_1.000_Length_6979::g.40116::m.40116